MLIITLALARDICRKVAAGDPAGELKIREQSDGEAVIRDYRVWFHPAGLMNGIFLIVKDRGGHGELETMFSPSDGRAYFDAQPGHRLH